MALDLKQCVAGLLTLSMFVMLGNMVKKDNFDYMVDNADPDTTSLEISDKHHPGIKLSEQTTTTFGEELWKKDEDPMKPCWKKHLPNKKQQSKGFITFSLSNGPEFHHSQVANAVVVAYYLGATLVLPDITGSGNTADDKMKFDEIYDAKKFIESLSGIINVVKKQPAEALHVGHPVKVPNRVSADYIQTHIEPKFRAKGNLNIVTYFPAVNMGKENKSNALDTVACLAMFGSLHLRPEVQELVDSMVEKVRVFSEKSDGQFISLDLRVEMLDKKGCQSTKGTSKSCYNPVETSQFLKKIGVSQDTTIYLTQTIWHNRLDALRSSFPKLYTKGDLMPADKKQIKMLGKSSEYEKVIDFYICTESDVFVPAISGFFYANVAGKRIAAGKTQILVPTPINDTSPTSASEYISPYVSKRNHFAYLCFC